MKIRVSFSDPEAVELAVLMAVRSRHPLPAVSAKELNAFEREDLFLQEHLATIKKVRSWFELGTYLTIEFDTDNDTATVLRGAGGDVEVGRRPDQLQG